MQLLHVGWRCCSTPANRKPRLRAGWSAVPGTCSGGGTCNFSSYGVLRVFLHQFIRRVFYPLGRNLRLCQTSGIVSTTTSVGRVWSSYTRRGRRLANSRPPAELRGSLDEGNRDFEGFYVSRVDDTLQLLIFTAPIQFFRENIYLQRLQFKVRNSIRNQAPGIRNTIRNQEPGIRIPFRNSP